MIRSIEYLSPCGEGMVLTNIGIPLPQVEAASNQSGKNVLISAPQVPAKPWPLFWKASTGSSEMGIRNELGGCVHSLRIPIEGAEQRYQ